MKPWKFGLLLGGITYAALTLGEAVGVAKGVTSAANAFGKDASVKELTTKIPFGKVNITFHK